MTTTIARDLQPPWAGYEQDLTGLKSLDEIRTVRPEIFLPVRLADAHVRDENFDLRSELDIALTLGTGPTTDQILGLVERAYPPIPDRFATVREQADGSIMPYEVFKSRYAVVSDENVIDRALTVVAASGGEAVFNMVATFKEGAQFAAIVDLGATAVDPAGVNDVIQRYLLVLNSHNGTWPIVFANLGMRWFCKNMVRSLNQIAQSMIKARHTPNHDNKLSEAQRVLGISTDWAREFKAMAEEMLAIPMTAGRLDRVVDATFPMSASPSERQQANRQELMDTVRVLYANNRNAGAVGDNGWAAYNTVVEYIDHHRATSGESRALGILDQSSTTSKAKDRARDAVLALA